MLVPGHALDAYQAGHPARDVPRPVALENQSGRNPRSDLKNLNTSLAYYDAEARPRPRARWPRARGPIVVPKFRLPASPPESESAGWGPGNASSVLRPATHQSQTDGQGEIQGYSSGEKEASLVSHCGAASAEKAGRWRLWREHAAARLGGCTEPGPGGGDRGVGLEVSDDVISKLEFLREAALDLRYAYAVEDLEECRRRVSRHPSGLLLDCL